MNMIDPNLSKRNIETTTSYDFASQEYKISFSWLNSVYPKNYSIKQICSLISSTVFSKDFSYVINTIIPDNRTNPPRMTLPRRAWVRLNLFRIGVGRLRSCLHKQGTAPSTACERGVEEQTVEHVVLHCPIHRPPHGFNSLMVLDDEAIDWLLSTWPKI